MVTVHGAEWSWSGDVPEKHSGPFSLWIRVQGPLHCDVAAFSSSFAALKESNIAVDVRYKWSHIKPCPKQLKGCSQCPTDKCHQEDIAICDGSPYWECLPKEAARLQMNASLAGSGVPVNLTQTKHPNISPLPASIRISLAAMAGKSEASQVPKTVKKDFRHAVFLPKQQRPEPEVDLDVMHHAEDVEDDSDLDPAYISPKIRQRLGVPLEVKLPQSLQAAAEETGYTRGVRTIQKSVVKMQAKKRDEHLQEKPPPIGSVHLDEQLLRKLFQKMDLDNCEAISSKVLRHLFLQMGREIAPEELEAMITMVDMKEMGSATYEDFAAIFGNPAESLRLVNVEAVQAAARGEVRQKKDHLLPELEEESEEEDHNSDGDDQEDDEAIENG
eukprot:symbB.v1.2.009883.t1/scaffold639.1/size181572/4